MYYIESTKKHSTYPIKNELRDHGFEWDRERRSWVGECSDLSYIRSLDRRGYKVTDTSFSRSSNYRDVFLKTYLPPYHCAYCGRKLTRRELTVDHWIPIHKLSVGKRRGHYQRLLRWFCRTDDPNNPKNLVCACASCNNKKRTQTGRWLLLGALGKTHWFWPTWRLLWAGFIIYGIYLLIPLIENTVTT